MAKRAPTLIQVDASQGSAAGKAGSWKLEAGSRDDWTGLEIQESKLDQTAQPCHVVHGDQVSNSWSGAVAVRG
ncbi:hypothetical protein E4U54_005094, partial [Claviceps lovelessii]